jgi:FMN-dependent NADH-azoreductase
MHLLHIVSSPRKQLSASLQVANSFIDAWLSKHPGSQVDTLNVWEMELLPFDGPALEAKYVNLTGGTMSAEQAAVWAQIADLGKRFHQADVIVFSVPMWNFGIPYRLKHLIDVVSQKDVLFTFDERGLRGMLGGRKVVAIAARGVAWGEDYPLENFDHQVAYLVTWSRMVGVSESEFFSVVTARTLGEPEMDKAARQKAAQEAAELANKL